MKSIEQQQNGADSDHSAEDERVPSLPEVDPLDHIVDSWEAVYKSQTVRNVFQIHIFHLVNVLMETETLFTVAQNGGFLQCKSTKELVSEGFMEGQTYKYIPRLKSNLIK